MTIVFLSIYVHNNRAGIQDRLVSDHGNQYSRPSILIRVFVNNYLSDFMSVYSESIQLEDICETISIRIHDSFTTNDDKHLVLT